MLQTFEYRVRGRRPVVLLALLVLAALFVVAYFQQAPWYIWFIWAASGASIIYVLLTDQKSGLTLTSQSLEYYVGTTSTVVFLENIDHVEFLDWADSSDVTIYKRDGSKETIHTTAVPATSTLESELNARGVKTVRS